MKDDKSIIGKIKALFDSDVNIFFTSVANTIISIMVIAIFLFAANWIKSYYNANNVFADYVVYLLIQWYTLMFVAIMGMIATVVMAALVTKTNYHHIIMRLVNASYHMISFATGIGLVSVAIISLSSEYSNSLAASGFILLGCALILYITGWPFYKNFGLALTYIGKRFYRKAKRDLSNNKKIGSVAEAP